jgi:hypothetical protein
MPSRQRRTSHHESDTDLPSPLRGFCIVIGNKPWVGTHG